MANDCTTLDLGARGQLRPKVSPVELVEAHPARRAVDEQTRAFHHATFDAASAGEGGEAEIARNTRPMHDRSR